MITRPSYALCECSVLPSARLVTALYLLPRLDGGGLEGSRQINRPSTSKAHDWKRAQLWRPCIEHCICVVALFTLPAHFCNILTHSSPPKVWHQQREGAARGAPQNGWPSLAFPSPIACGHQGCGANECGREQGRAEQAAGECRNMLRTRSRCTVVTPTSCTAECWAKECHG